MDYKLEQEILHFFRVHDSRIEDTLKKYFPAGVPVQLKEAMSEESSLLKDSLFEFLAKEL